MTDKAYIVANKQQEFDVLKKLEQNDLTWKEGEQPTEWVPSETSFKAYNFGFPYALIAGESIIWDYATELTDEEVVYDGRTLRYIVQRKDPVSRFGREYLYISVDKSLKFVYEQHRATRFDDYMEAREWAGIHFEVVEVDE